MESRSNRLPAEPLDDPRHGYGLLVELEPGFKSFLSNFADLFRRAAPLSVTAAVGEYWPDALVHRPIAWKAIVQSYLAHGLAVAAVYAGCLWWLNQPHVIVEEPLQTATILNYQISEYLPEVKPKSEETPRRQKAQTADPEYSPQKIVSLNVDRRSTRQTIVEADPNLLSQDARLPNIVAWTPVPIAPPETAHQRMLDLPSGAPVVVPPAQPTVEHGTARLTFPPAAKPEVAPPSAPVAAGRTLQMPAMDSPVVVPPSQEVAPRDASRLQLQVQAPQVAAAPTDIASRTGFSNQALALAQPEVVAPAQETGQRNLSATTLPDAAPNVAPPAPPVASGMGQPQSRDAGQLLALNASPLPPDGPIKVPAGNRQGEFAAGPEGHRGASATPEAAAGNPSAGNRSGGGFESVYVEAPPVKIAGGTVVTGPRLAPPLAAKAPASARSDVPASDPIDNQVFGGRRRYSMRLNLPNLTSAMGSWTVKFAELNMNPLEHDAGDLTAPEAIRKVDPAYPANLMKDRVEGVVVLHAVIRSDGTVAEVRVLEGFFDELDENARAALTQWRFRPGTKNGIPIDVEAVIRVPFRVSHSAF